MISRRSALSGGTAAAGVVALGGGFGVDARASAREAAAEAGYPPIGDILDVGGVPVHAYVRGAGPDLVMIHGASGNLREWTFHLIGRLAPRYRCIAFDRPGLGYTGHTAPRYARAFSSASDSPVEQAALLAAAYAQIGDGTPLVMGHSYGGTVALAWGLDHPARALVPLSAPSMTWEGGLGTLIATLASAAGGALVVPVATATVRLATLRDMTRQVFAPNPVPDGYFDHIGTPLTLRRDTLRSNARQVNGLKPQVEAMSLRYAGLTLPIEMVHGAEDDTVPPGTHSQPFAAQVPSANLVMVPGAGHMVHHADPEACIAAIDRADARSR